MAKSKCTCGDKKAVFCTFCSKIRMSIMLKNGQKHLKVFNATTNRNTNPVWYSPIKYNHQDIKKVINKMADALKKQSTYSGAVNCLLFYDNKTNQFLEKITL